MNTSLSWIKMYVPDLDVTAQEYTDAMTLSGTKVENYERLDEHLEKIVIGQIEKIEKHPDADKLIVCQVNVGTETVQIVTGAPNVKEGDKVPVVLDGGMVAGDHDGNKSEGGTRIKAGKLRGVESYGMMCSIEELGSSREFYPEAPEYGIYIFPEDAVVGESAIHALGLDDTIIEYEITSNRVDCYSVIGIAREAAATFHKKFCPPQVKETGNNENAADYIKVQVEDTELCPRYCARVVKNVKIGPSPKWMQRALAANGIRPINNLVDITNYVMEEYGQPMHAYDLDTIAGRQIIVRRAEKDEKFVTLDGQERTMDENVLMICDAEKAVGIAGIMGGGMVDVYPVKREPVRVKFEPERINAILGTSLTKEEMLNYLEPVELAYDEAANEIIAPTFRQDIHCTADIAEEVVRFFGYDNVPTTLPSGEATTGKLPFKMRVEAVARDVAEYCGFSQGMCYSFESPKVFDKLLLPKDDPQRNAITIRNPLGEDFSIMRTIPLNGMLTSLATNYKRRNKNVRLYELGNIYLPKELPLKELPEERMMFTLGMYGDGDFYDMKGVVEELLDKLGMRKRPEYHPKAGKPFLHPGRQAEVLYEGMVLGYLGEVHPQVADNYGIGGRAYVAVIDILNLMECATFDRKYTGLAKYPAVARDLSMVVPKNVLAGDIEHVLVQRGGKILENYQLFDIYEGAQIKEGYKSMAYTVVFRSKDRTLKEEDINGAMKKILNGLQGLGVELRQ